MRLDTSGGTHVHSSTHHDRSVPGRHVHGGSIVQQRVALVRREAVPLRTEKGRVSHARPHPQSSTLLVRIHVLLRSNQLRILFLVVKHAGTTEHCVLSLLVGLHASWSICTTYVAEHLLYLRENQSDQHIGKTSTLLSHTALFLLETKKEPGVGSGRCFLIDVTTFEFMTYTFVDVHATEDSDHRSEHYNKEDKLS